MTEPRGITIVGLGAGDAGQITRQAWDWLSTQAEVWLRTRQHPAVAGLPPGVTVRHFDDLEQQDLDLARIRSEIVQRVLELGRRPQGVTYAVPGHPYVAEATGPEIIRLAGDEGLPVQIIEGISLVEAALTALGIGPLPQLTLLDALEFGGWHVPPFSPSAPALVCQVSSRQIAGQVKQVLLSVYPPEHPVQLVWLGGPAGSRVQALSLAEIDSATDDWLPSSLYLPVLAHDAAFEAFQELVAHLRAPNGCPWDREQTHLTLRKHLLEESYEALEAIDSQDIPGMVEELGDLLLQIVLHAQIGAEANTFHMADVIQGIHRKIVRRHPHVFGDVQVEGVGGVLVNWERLKAAERSTSLEEKHKGLLDGVPVIFPALAQAQEIQDRAARVGFDWADEAPVIEKIHEEIKEVLSAPTLDALTGEIGDLLFAVVNLARWRKVDAEATLRETNARFRRRFSHIEKRTREMGLDLHGMTLNEMDVLWDEAKKLE